MHSLVYSGLVGHDTLYIGESGVRWGGGAVMVGGTCGGQVGGAVMVGGTCGGQVGGNYYLYTVTRV